MSKSNRAILNYQQRCSREYSSEIKLLPEPYTYPNGNPIRPLPPIQTAVGGMMIIGAYPSARFESRPSKRMPGKSRLIPIADNLQPFGNEQYFDGQRIRTLESGDGLRKYLLSEPPFTADQCWITDLVKVFLYKKDHELSCGDVVPEFKVPVLRSRFLEIAEDSIKWMREECELCKPKLILTLGEEVAQVISDNKNAKADDLLSREIAYTTKLGNYPVLYLPHPDACRRFEKWRKNMKERCKLIQKYVR